MNVKSWNGKVEDTSIHYEYDTDSAIDVVGDAPIAPAESIQVTYSDDDIRADKYDCLVAASSGFLTAAIDVLWVGEFSLRYAQDIGTEQINNFVISIAQSKGCNKGDLKGCIKFLEKMYPMASDKLTPEFGYSLQHHLRDFSHHASPFGLICSILNQFTKKGYGTNTEGKIITPDIPQTDALGNSFEEKIMFGVVKWFFHLVSDMAGSSSSSGHGTGIPGPLLSFAKMLSVTPIFHDLKVEYKGDDIGLSVWISKLFNGTAFKHTGRKDIVRFDLRTELGIGNFAVKQSIPVLINQCIVRSFYFIRRLAQEYSDKKIKSVMDIKKLDSHRFLPFNNRCIARMITISTGIFTVVNGADARIRAKIKSPNDNTKAVTDTLLRLNFVGIGAFVFSIRNEWKYAVQDAKGFIHKKTKAQMLLEQPKHSEEVSLVSQSIEIELDMDNSNLYQYTFDNLLNMVKLSRDEHVSSHDKIRTQIGKIFDLGEGNYSVYKSIVEANEYRAIKAIETLIIKMCEQNNIEFEFYPVDECFRNRSYNIEKSRPFQMVMHEDGLRIGYVFCEADTSYKHIHNFKAGDYSVDALRIIRLYAPNEVAYNTLFAVPNEIYRKEEINVRLITLEELFDSLFGKDEYSIFIEYVDAFNAKAKGIIGFNTVLAPTDSAIERFKEKTGKVLYEYPYKEFLPSDIYKTQVELLCENYLGRGLWRAMIGTSDFAVSFITSEWNYEVYQLTDNLDLTGIIAGYLKSVEQLLFKVLSLSKNKGISIMSRDCRIVDFSEDNEKLIDTTLGSLEAAIQHNGDILDVTPYVKKYVVSNIKDWREKQRNGYFHKDNLHSVDKVTEIRGKAIYLYFLILGACTIRDEQFEVLGILPEDKIVADGFKYEMFVQWLEPILNYNLPKETVAVCLNLYDTKEEWWELQLTATNAFDENDDHWTWKEVFSSGHNLYKWCRLMDEKATFNEVVNAIKQYMAEGTYSTKLAIYKAVAVSSRCYTEIAYKK